MGKLNNCLKKLMKKRKKNKTNAWGRESCPGTQFNDKQPNSIYKSSFVNTVNRNINKNYAH